MLIITRIESKSVIFSSSSRCSSLSVSARHLDWWLNQGDSLATSMPISTISRCLNSVVNRSLLEPISAGPRARNASGCFAAGSSMYVCGTLPYDQTAEGHRHVFGHFWASTHEEQREEVRQDLRGLLVHMRRQLVLDWHIWSPPLRPPTHSSPSQPVSGTRWTALHSTTRLSRDTKWRRVLHSRPTQTPSELPQRHCSPDLEDCATRQLLRIPSALPGSFTKGSLASHFAVSTLQVLSQDISNELDQPT